MSSCSQILARMIGSRRHLMSVREGGFVLATWMLSPVAPPRPW